MKFISSIVAKPAAKAVAAAALVSAIVLTGCSATPPFNYQNITVSIAPIENQGNIVTTATGGVAIILPATYGNTTASSGATQEFQANVTNTSPNTTWSLAPTYPAYATASQAGEIFYPTGDTVFYNGPTAVPVYTGSTLAAANAAGIPQGSAQLIAAVQADPANPASVVTSVYQFAIVYNNGPLGPNGACVIGSSTNPCSTIPILICGLNPISAIIVHGATQQFTGYCVGALDNSFQWQVNGVVGGSAATGTISASGFYTAPAVVPATPTVTISVVSNVRPDVVTSGTITTGTATATVTLQ
jgi:hypothetical protein